MKISALLSVLAICISCGVQTTNSALQDESARNIETILCEDENGDRELLIEWSENELPFPTYHLKLYFHDQVVLSQSDLLLVANSESKFMIQDIRDIEHRKGIQISAGINWYDGKKEGFYMEAANEGASPLPGLTFSRCRLKEFIQFESDL